MADPGFFHGPNAGYVLGLYDRFLADPSSMDAGWRGYFESFSPEEPAPDSEASTDTPATVDVAAIVGAHELAEDGRSTRYASDFAKGFEIPIVHVNAGDVHVCLAVAKLALAYRERYHRDFVIDLVGYRRWGHNEGDEPAFTQPRMYEVIAPSPPPSRPASSRRPGMARHPGGGAEFEPYIPDRVH
jgi:2-oxoglutarate dehydrogenase complex dehydrogenase (E1) component-like enzyme